MKAFKYIFILILIVIIGGAIYFSLKDGKYDITESRIIAAPPSLIYDQLADFKEWDNWNPWLEDEEITSTMGTQTKGVDGNYSFTDPYGNGKMTITGIEPNKYVAMNMFYDNGMTSSNSDVIMDLERVENGTKVTWNIKSEQGLLDKVMTTVLGFNMEDEIKPKYTAGLENLDNYVNNQMSVHQVHVDGIIETGGGYFLYMSSSTKREKLQIVKSQMLQNIMSYMNRNHIDMYGMPRVVYEKIDPTNNSVLFSAALPVENREITATNSNILSSYQEPGKAVKITLNGAYSNLAEAWRKGEEFISQNGLVKAIASPYEIYKTDPMLTPNPADYRTEIYIPIE
ncbi:SRPBCC family protein [Nonlabens sp. Asnod2-A12]|uniref:SRPBCC family protein n=1 Tax=Nonlabens sp. Asnod2-A12 TaxID=3160578 RepID=UPI00386E25FC